MLIIIIIIIIKIIIIMIIILIIVIIIVILIVINSYIIVKDKDVETIIKIMLKIKIKNEWSFLTTANTITTNKTAITDKALTGEDKKTKIKQQKKQNKNKKDEEWTFGCLLTYYTQTMKWLPCLKCIVKITFLMTKRGMWYQYNSFCLKVFTVSEWSIIVMSQSPIPVMQIMFVKTFVVTALVWKYFFFSKITMRAFVVVSSSAKFCQGTTIVLPSYILSNIPPF